MTDEPQCTCGQLVVGQPAQPVGRNWEADCAAHGIESVWWNAPEQVADRKRRSDNLRALQAAARKARQGAASVLIREQDALNRAWLADRQDEWESRFSRMAQD